MASSAGTFERCPKCQTRPATSGRNNWCAECNRAYQAEYQENRLTMAKDKGFHEGFKKGAEAMRAELMKSLAKAHPAGMLRAKEVLDWIRKAPEVKSPSQSSES